MAIDAGNDRLHRGKATHALPLHAGAYCQLPPEILGDQVNAVVATQRRWMRNAARGSEGAPRLSPSLLFPALAVGLVVAVVAWRVMGAFPPYFNW